LRFSEVIGQSFVKKRLTSMVQDNRLSHALLLLSKEGSGGLAVALALAQYLVCEKVTNPQNSPSLFGDAKPAIIPDDSCGVCSSCSQYSGENREKGCYICVKIVSVFRCKQVWISWIQ
jgi:DNA polymerase-3 subunit delta'